GLHLYPGLLDAGICFGPAPTLYPSTVRDFHPEYVAGAGADEAGIRFSAARARGVVGVMALPFASRPEAGGVLAAQSSLLSLAADRPMEFVRQRSLALHLRVDEAAPLERWDELAELFVTAAHYHRLKTEAEARRSPPPPTDPRLEALGPYVKKSQPTAFHANSVAELRAALRLTKRLGVRGVLVGARDAAAIVGEIKAAEVAVAYGPVAAGRAHLYAPYDVGYRTPGLLYDNKIPFCLVSGGLIETADLRADAALAVAYGLPPEAAMEAVTLAPAKIFGVDGQTGSIAVGRRADLLLTDGDPLQPTTKVRGLWIGGRLSSRRTEGDELYRRLHRPPAKTVAATVNEKRPEPLAPVVKETAKSAPPKAAEAKPVAKEVEKSAEAAVKKNNGPDGEPPGP
ncbi:MAG: amidohydrolase family protein, partial [Planctomycetia bacterium]